MQDAANAADSASTKTSAEGGIDDGLGIVLLGRAVTRGPALGRAHAEHRRQ